MEETQTVVVLIHEDTSIVFKSVTGYIKNSDGSVSIYEGAKKIADIGAGRYIAVYFDDAQTGVKVLVE